MPDFANSYAGPCVGCGKRVSPHQGTAHLHRGIRRDFWTVRCAACSAGEVQPQLAEPTSCLPSMSRDEAIRTFKRLVAQHGTSWTGRQPIPPEDWALIGETAKVLTDADRREALGLGKG